MFVFVDRPREWIQFYRRLPPRMKEDAKLPYLIRDRKADEIRFRLEARQALLAGEIKELDAKNWLLKERRANGVHLPRREREQLGQYWGLRSSLEYEIEYLRGLVQWLEELAGRVAPKDE